MSVNVLLKRSISILAILFFCGTVLAQNSSVKLTSEEQQAVVERISEMLLENYVFPDIAKKNVAYLQEQLKRESYKSVTAPEDFARQLTEDLQHINKDKHMRVRMRKPERAALEESDPLLARLKADIRRSSRNYGFEKVERFDNNVGYVDFRYFDGSQEAKKVAASTMHFLAGSDAIIFDMRKNGGGNPEMVQFICSYFFGEKTHLNSLYWREGDETHEFWTLDSLPGKRMPDVPLFVLTSKRTFSGAEEFSYNFQTRKRATLIGETTGGGANPGGTAPINRQFEIFIPTGKAINPVTGTNWEGVGVKPDIPVFADSALSVALRHAKVAATEFAARKEAALLAKVEQFRADLAASEKNAENRKQMVNTALQGALDAKFMRERDINQLGYQYLADETFEMAIQVFIFNTEAFPRSANTYDSLGEAYMLSGDKPNAINNYKRSLELDPANGNAVNMLKQMGAKL
ncbi:MAG: S41 family peptidase [Calditrichia bacterium]